MKRAIALVIPAAALGLGIALLVGAGCPTGDDLADGVVFVNDQIKYASIDMGDGLYWQGWQSKIVPDGWQIYRYQGLFKLAALRNSGALPSFSTFDVPLGTLFPLKVGDTHAHGEVIVSKDQGLTWDYQHEMKVEREDEVSFGACRYSALHIRFTSSFERSDGMKKKTGSRQVYIPELKAGFRPGKYGIGGITKVRKLARADGLKPQPAPPHVVAQTAFANGKVE